MAKCAGCGKFLAAAVATGCNTCPLLYHKACVSFAEGAVGRDWSCPDCKRKIKKGDNSCTPVRCTGTGGPVGDQGQEASSPGPEGNTSSLEGIPSEDFQSFRKEITEYMAELREFRREIAEERAARAALYERIDSLELRLEAVEQRRPEVGSASEGVAELEQTVAVLKAELNDRDQEALLSDLDIGHLPEEKGENVVHVVSVLASRLGVPLQEQDVVFAERVGAAPVAGGRARRVLVRLARRQLRDDLLRAARVRRTLTAGAARVFVNERLTRTNSQLFHRVREECRRQCWKYSWTRRGRIYVRKTEGQAALPIRTDADLVRVFGLERVGQTVSRGSYQNTWNQTIYCRKYNQGSAKVVVQQLLCWMW